MRSQLFSLWMIGTVFGCPATLQAADDHDHDHPRAEPVPAKAADTPAASDPHEHGGKHEHDAHEHADEVTLTEAAVKASGIKIETATARTLRPTLVAPARVAFDADAMAHVGSPVRGRAVEIKVKHGQAVKKGEALLVIESPELGEAQSELIQKHAAVAVARAAVRPAKESVERAQKLYDQSEGIPLADLQKRQAELIAAEGALQTATAAATAAENKLKLLGMDSSAVSELLRTGEVVPRYALRAPIDGTVIERDVTQGELVSPEKEPLIVLADPARLWVWADVPEDFLTGVRIGSTAMIQSTASADAVSGTVTLLASTVNEDTRTGRVRIEIDGAGSGFRPGMFLKAEIPAEHAGGGTPEIVVPERAVQWVEGRTAVFVPVDGEPNTFAKRDVRIGKAVAGFVPVRAGLKDGEQFVSDGSFILKADLGKSGAAHEH